jgi:uncharacterized protein YbjT (DUF2867 family)
MNRNCGSTPLNLTSGLQVFGMESGHNHFKIIFFGIDHMSTAIVIGATGLIGSNLVAQLVNEDSVEKIIAITRRPVEYESSKVVNRVIDFDRIENYKDAFVGDFLFSCLGTTKKQAGSLEAQRKVDLEYQYKAAEISSENKVPHYLLVSSSGADENSNAQYFKMKGELETKVMTLPFERVSIFQPSLLLGNRDKFRLGEYLAGLLLPTLCLLPVLKRYRPIDGKIVARKMIEVSSKPGNSREIYSLDELFL